MSDLDFIRKDKPSSSELELEQKLRPLRFDDFRGQARTIENLKIFVQAAKQRGEALDHVRISLQQNWAFI